MTLATASTQAEAVRQHGGGLAHHLPTTTQPAGRHTCSTGGDIDRRRVAASLIAPASRPCGAHAYPLTGVRRAAHPAAPLRSTPRHHAKPGEGYTHPLHAMASAAQATGEATQ